MAYTLQSVRWKISKIEQDIEQTIEDCRTFDKLALAHLRQRETSLRAEKIPLWNMALFLLAMQEGAHFRMQKKLGRLCVYLWTNNYAVVCRERGNLFSNNQVNYHCYKARDTVMCLSQFPPLNSFCLSYVKGLAKGLSSVLQGPFVSCCCLFP